MARVRFTKLKILHLPELDTGTDCDKFITVIPIMCPNLVELGLIMDSD